MPLLARIRPNFAYLFLLGILTAVVVYGAFVRADLPGIVIACTIGALLVLLGYPVIASTVFRVPVLAVTEQGIRLPLFGPRLSWSEIAAVHKSAKTSGQRQIPVVLIVPIAPEGVIAQVRPWLRADARANLARFGTPIVIPGASLDRSLDEIVAAAQRP